MNLETLRYLDVLVSDDMPWFLFAITSEWSQKLLLGDLESFWKTFDGTHELTSPANGLETGNSMIF